MYADLTANIFNLILHKTINSNSVFMSLGMMNKYSSWRTWTLIQLQIIIQLTFEH